MKYRVLVADRIHKLEENVQVRLDDGWQLQGGVGIDNSSNCRYFYQAMVKT